jgi:hypothetical protein
MGAEGTGVAGGLNARDFERRTGVGAGVDEEHALSALEVERMFDLELVVVEHLDARVVAQPLAQRLREARTQRVVTAAGVAPGEDEGRRQAHVSTGGRCSNSPRPERRARSSTDPSPSHSVTSSGMRPIACVAHDRQGS